MSLCIVFLLFSSLGSDLLFCESACAKSCFESFDKNTNKNQTGCYHFTEGHSGDALICSLLCLRSCPRCSSTQKRSGTTGRWPTARARSSSQSRRLPHTLDLNSSWHHMYLFQFTHSPETSWKDTPPTRGRPVRRAWP